MSRKIGFWSVFAIVTGSQIGTGVFMLPASLAEFGLYSLGGWLISGMGALALCHVFAYLCSRFPKTGGPHVFIKNIFGKDAAFFTGWTYWIISWVSTTAVVVTAIASLSPFLGNAPSYIYLALQIILLLFITGLNLRGVAAAGSAEKILIMLKFIPLLIIPFAAFAFFDMDNFIISSQASELSTSNILSRVTMLTLWGFIGIETATAPAGSVHDPSRTIPRAIIFGTLSVVILYIINSVGIMGAISGHELIESRAPYVDVTRKIFGGSWYLLISIITSLVCIGTLNAWVLSASQIVLGLAEDGLIPNFMAKKNKYGAPIFGILVSNLGILPLLFLTLNENFASQINEIIDFSVTAFLFIYLFCSCAFIKLIIKEKSISLFRIIYGLGAILFSLWVISETPFQILLIASAFIFSGIPLYILWFKRSA